MIQRRQATATRGSPVLPRQSAVTMAGPLIQFRPSPNLNESVNGTRSNLAFKSTCSITRGAGYRALDAALDHLDFSGFTVLRRSRSYCRPLGRRYGQPISRLADHIS